MGCGQSGLRVQPIGGSRQAPVANIPHAVVQESHDTGPLVGPYDQGATVLLEGKAFKIQYVTSSGSMDLKADNGDVQYGVPREQVTLPSSGLQMISVASTSAASATPAPAATLLVAAAAAAAAVAVANAFAGGGVCMLLQLLLQLLLS